jgi:hypothetical protein
LPFSAGKDTLILTRMLYTLQPIVEVMCSWCTCIHMHAMLELPAGTLTWTQWAPYLQTLSLWGITAPAGTTLPEAWGNVSGTVAFPALKTLRLWDIPAMEGPLPSSWLTGFPALRSLRLRGMPLLGADIQLGDWLAMMQAAWRWSPAPAPLEAAELQLSGVGLEGPWPASVGTDCWWVGAGWASCWQSWAASLTGFRLLILVILQCSPAEAGAGLILVPDMLQVDLRGPEQQCAHREPPGAVGPL